MLKIHVNGGFLIANVSGDAQHPGIWIEFEPDKELDECHLSVPTVLVEQDEKGLRALVWGRSSSEDFTDEIRFN